MTKTTRPNVNRRLPRAESGASSPPSRIKGLRRRFRSPRYFGRAMTPTLRRYGCFMLEVYGSSDCRGPLVRVTLQALGCSFERATAHGAERRLSHGGAERFESVGSDCPAAVAFRFVRLYRQGRTAQSPRAIRTEHRLAATKRRTDASTPVAVGSQMVSRRFRRPGAAGASGWQHCDGSRSCRMRHSSIRCDAVLRAPSR